MAVLFFRAFWKGLRGNSLVFSLVFALAMTGFSLAGILRSPMRAFGLWGPLIFILPIIAIGWAAKLEKRLRLRDGFRRFCCLLLIAGSILLSYELWRYETRLTERYRDSIRPGPAFRETDDGPPRVLPRGPRNRR